MTPARNPKKAKTPIPQGMDSAAAADFFDAHDATELAWEPAGEAPETAGRIAPLSATFSIRFEAEHKDAIWQLAEARRERPTAMLRRWILERLASEGAIDPAAVDMDRLATAVAERVAAELRPLLPDTDKCSRTAAMCTCSARRSPTRLRTR